MNTSTPITFRTIKAAEAAGFHRMKEYEYGGEQITVKGVLLVRNSQEAISETAWRKEGRKVIPKSQPHGIRTFQVGGRKSVTYAVYRLDQTVHLLTRPPPHPTIAYPLTQQNILAAIFSVNRSAKRFRDAAQSCYQADAHGFAKCHKNRKEKLYDLKDRGIIHAYRAGFVSAMGLHGSLTVYRGEGYCFHSPLRPQNVTLESASDELVFVEAKPRKVSEMRLRDAIATLEQILSDIEGFSRHAVPRGGPRSRPIDDELECCDPDDNQDDDWDDDPDY